MARYLRWQGYCVGRKRARRLMWLMGLISVAPKPNTGRKSPGHPVYLYLLRDLHVDQPNRAWCVDVTYIRLAHGFLYLTATVERYSRKALT